MLCQGLKIKDLSELGAVRCSWMGSTAGQPRWGIAGGGLTEGFILLLMKSHQVINKGVLSRGRFVGPPLLPAGVEGPILHPATHSVHHPIHPSS